MYTIQEIQKLISEGKFEKAIEKLDHAIEQNPLNAEWWYLRGRVYWKTGQRANAISDYEEAVHINPESPAKKALEMANDIMDFFNHDLMNP